MTVWRTGGALRDPGATSGTGCSSTVARCRTSSCPDRTWRTGILRSFESPPGTTPMLSLPEECSANVNVNRFRRHGTHLSVADARRTCDGRRAELLRSDTPKMHRNIFPQTLFPSARTKLLITEMRITTCLRLSRPRAYVAAARLGAVTSCRAGSDLALSAAST